jgi:hypothetical protein
MLRDTERRVANGRARAPPASKNKTAREQIEKCGTEPSGVERAKRRNATIEADRNNDSDESAMTTLINRSTRRSQSAARHTPRSARRRARRDARARPSTLTAIAPTRHTPHSPCSVIDTTHWLIIQPVHAPTATLRRSLQTSHAPRFRHTQKQQCKHFRNRAETHKNKTPLGATTRCQTPQLAHHIQRRCVNYRSAVTHNQRRRRVHEWSARDDGARQQFPQAQKQQQTTTTTIADTITAIITITFRTTHQHQPKKNPERESKLTSASRCCKKKSV